MYWKPVDSGHFRQVSSSHLNL